jgi:hypothetical protein
MIIRSHSQEQMFLNLNLQYHVTLINIELNPQRRPHVQQLRSEAKFIQLFFFVSTTPFDRSYYVNLLKPSGNFTYYQV